MGKGPNIIPRIEELIAEIYLQNRGIGATNTRKELLEKMKEEGLDKNFSPGYPSVSSVSIRLKECKKNDKGRAPALKELDQPWNTGTLGDHNILPEALPHLMQIQASIRTKKNGEFLRVREAIWIARLFPVIVNNQVVKKMDTEDKNISLLAAAAPYARREEISELIGTILNTSDLDDALISGNIDLVYLQNLREMFKNQPVSPIPFSLESRGNKLAQSIHENLELTSDIPDFRTSGSYVEYAIWLQTFSGYEWWSTASKEKRKQLVIRLQDWVKNNEPDFSYKRPEEILEDIRCEDT
ncbi:hypothetical protein ACFLW1_02105 [Chloroflexota bacterium]